MALSEKRGRGGLMFYGSNTKGIKDIEPAEHDASSKDAIDAAAGRLAEKYDELFKRYQIVRGKVTLRA